MQEEQIDIDPKIEIVISQYEKRGDGMNAYVVYKIVTKVQSFNSLELPIELTIAIFSDSWYCSWIYQERIRCMASIQRFPGFA